MTTKKKPAAPAYDSPVVKTGPERLATIDDLEAVVATMRALGVIEYGNIKLGPEPVKGDVTPPSPRELQARLERAEERQRDIRFAASSIKPALSRRDT